LPLSTIRPARTANERAGYLVDIEAVSRQRRCRCREGDHRRGLSGPGGTWALKIRAAWRARQVKLSRHLIARRGVPVPFDVDELET
jgi:hypothetical protein